MNYINQHPSCAQLLAAGSGQYSVYPPTLPQEGGAWDAVVKASETLLREKELVIDRY